MYWNEYENYNFQGKIKWIQAVIQENRNIIGIGVGKQFVCFSLVKIFCYLYFENNLENIYDTLYT